MGEMCRENGSPKLSLRLWIISETQNVEGHWRHGGVLYRDDLVRVVVDVPDTPRNRQWMREFKQRWRTRLEQLELWMVSFRIEVE
jgi:hypothetical protein